MEWVDFGEVSAKAKHRLTHWQAPKFYIKLVCHSGASLSAARLQAAAMHPICGFLTCASNPLLYYTFQLTTMTIAESSRIHTTNDLQCGPREHSYERVGTSTTEHSQLLKLPFEIREQVLELLLHPFPDLHLTDDPSWLSFARGRASHCPSIFLACRQMYNECLRLFYSQVRVLVYPDREIFARLKRHPARRYIRKLDLALNCSPFGLDHRSHDLVDLPKFPRQVVGDVMKLLPSLNSVHVTICDSVRDIRATNEGKGMLKHPVRDMFDGQASSWRNMITLVRYQTGHAFTRLPVFQARIHLERKFRQICLLPALRRLHLYMITHLSSDSTRFDVKRPNTPERNQHLSTLYRREFNELQLPLTIVRELFPETELRLFRLVQQGRRMTTEKVLQDPLLALICRQPGGL